MAIDLFVRIRSELRILEQETERNMAECKIVYNENIRLREKIKELEDEVLTYKQKLNEYETGKGDNSGDA
jgi:predicted nuclease with TOPRIM domain